MVFLEAFEKLRNETPRLALMNVPAATLTCSNFTFQCSNSFYNVGSDFLEESHYNYWGYHNKNSIDCTYCRYCKDCYECLDCRSCISSSFLQDCENCEDCYACFDCSNLKNCFACIGISNKEYYVFNKPYSKEDYFEKCKKFAVKSPEELRSLFKDIKQLRPHIFMRQCMNKGICSGDYIYFSKNSQFCFDTMSCENCFYMNNAINCFECCDISYAGEPPLQGCYEIMSGMGLTDCSFCASCWHGSNLEYCEYCFNCRYCFGCIGLRDKKYCILNKPYKPEKYFKEIARIKAETKEQSLYGKWFQTTYPLEDTVLSDAFYPVEHALEKRSIEPETEIQYIHVPHLGI